MDIRRISMRTLAITVAAGALIGGQGLAAPSIAGSASPGERSDPAKVTATGAYVSFAKSDGAFPLVAGGHAAPIVVSGSDYTGVRCTVGDLADDVNRVTGIEPTVTTSDAVPTDSGQVVIVGTLGHSPLIDRVAAQHKFDSAAIQGKWETSIEQVVDNPVPGVKQALVIAGGDQRGTIYGAYDVSRGIGVSPWYWWDDVTPTHRDSLYIDAGTHTQGTPAVKYRGFFINDENPSLGRAAKNLFGEGKAAGYPGGFNHLLYAKVFEAGLRLKSNYIWPAVRGRTFDQDDPENQQTATDYGIVMGTSHEAPMASTVAPRRSSTSSLRPARTAPR